MSYLRFGIVNGLGAARVALSVLFGCCLVQCQLVSDTDELEVLCDPPRSTAARYTQECVSLREVPDNVKNCAEYCVSIGRCCRDSCSILGGPGPFGALHYPSACLLAESVLETQCRAPFGEAAFVDCCCSPLENHE